MFRWREVLNDTRCLACYQIDGDAVKMQLAQYLSHKCNRASKELPMPSWWLNHGIILSHSAYVVTGKVTSSIQIASHITYSMIVQVIKMQIKLFPNFIILYQTTTGQIFYNSQDSECCKRDLQTAWCSLRCDVAQFPFIASYDNYNLLASRYLVRDISYVSSVVIAPYTIRRVIKTFLTKQIYRRKLIYTYIYIFVGWKYNIISHWF